MGKNKHPQAYINPNLEVRIHGVQSRVWEIECMLAWLLISHMYFSDAMTHVLEDEEIIIVVSGASGVIYNRNTNYLEVTVGVVRT